MKKLPTVEEFQQSTAHTVKSSNAFTKALGAIKLRAWAGQKKGRGQIFRIDQALVGWWWVANTDDVKKKCAALYQLINAVTGSRRRRAQIALPRPRAGLGCSC
jgi:hypothetical protein